MEHTEVISAFLDNEPFDANELSRALSEPGGRELLLDMIALRAVVHEEAADTPVVRVRTNARERRLWVASGFAAAAVLFGAAGVVALKTQQPASTSVSVDAETPPRPDRVVTFEPGLEWHDVNR